MSSQSLHVWQKSVLGEERTGFESWFFIYDCMIQTFFFFLLLNLSFLYVVKKRIIRHPTLHCSSSPNCEGQFSSLRWLQGVVVFCYVYKRDITHLQNSTFFKLGGGNSFVCRLSLLDLKFVLVVLKAWKLYQWSVYVIISQLSRSWDLI